MQLKRFADEARNAYMDHMADETDTTSAIPTLEDWQHWTWVMGRAQQMLMEKWADSLPKGDGWPAAAPPWGAFPPAFGAGSPVTTDPAALFAAGAEAWAKGLETWGKMMGLDTEAKENARDRRFAAPEWEESPVFDTVRKTYLALSDKLLGTVQDIEGIDEETRQRGKLAAT